MLVEEDFVLKQIRRLLLTAVFSLVLVYVLIGLPLPYYIYSPGSADALDDIVFVEDGYASEGDMHLVTISSRPATAMQIVLSWFDDFSELVPKENVIPEGMDDKSYRKYQLQLMDTSQHSSVVVGYEAAGAEVDFENNGIIVINVVEDMPAEGKLEIGDRVIQVDDVPIKESQNLIDYVGSRDDGERITVTLERDGEEVEEEIDVQAFPDEPDRKGIGIQLMNDTEVIVDPPVDFDSKGIGGPSAGLMFALEMFDQLTEEDWTRGYTIVGTGEIDFEGNVHRIGGVDKKVVAADRAGAKVFFAPNEGGREGSNYEEAKEAAEKIGTDMDIIPVDNFEDALDYLKDLE